MELLPKFNSWWGGRGVGGGGAGGGGGLEKECLDWKSFEKLINREDAY